MSGKQVREQQSRDLRLNFFSAPIGASSPPTGKWLSSSRITQTPSVAKHKVRVANGACDCACK